MREPQGVASLALGYVLHWAFSPSLLNLKLQSLILFYSLPLNNFSSYAFNEKINGRLMERLMNKINGRLMRH